jgi:hypothetical protein
MGEIVIISGLENYTFTFYLHGMIVDNPLDKDKYQFTRIIQYRDVAEVGRKVELDNRLVKYLVYVKTKNAPKDPWKLWHVDEKERDRIYDRIKAGMQSYMENKHKWSTEVFLSKIAFEPVIGGEFKEAQSRQNPLMKE